MTAGMDTAMTQVVADDVMPLVPRRGVDPVAAEYRTVTASDLTDFATEDELDWLENQARPVHQASRLDAAVIALAIALTAALVGVTIGVFKLF